MILLVAAGVMPLLTYHLGASYLGFRADRDRLGVQALNLAQALGHAVEAELRTRIATLEVLALSSALQAGDLVAFRAEAEAEAVVARQSPGSNILLLRTDGQQVMNTFVPEGVPLPVRRDLTSMQRLLATGKPSVSDLYQGLVVRRPVVAIEVPVWGADGRIGHVLALNPTLDAFSTVIRLQKPNADWIVTLLDRTGLRIARVPGAESMVGTRAVEAFLARRAAQPAGIMELTSPEGEWLVAAMPNWRASAGPWPSAAPWRS